MRQVLYFILITVCNVGMFVTKDIHLNLVKNVENILEMTSPSSVLQVTLQHKSGFAHTEKGCYIGYSMCLNYYSKKVHIEVCAHHTTFKLVNFANLCEVYLQNCLYGIEKERNKPHVPDSFYYNKQDKNCQYYMDKGKTFNEAVRLYYLEGFKHTFSKNIKNMI